MTTKSFSHIVVVEKCRHRATRTRLAILLAALTLAGCGGDDEEPVLVEAGGTVTYQGKPVPDATIVFVPDGSGMPANGRTDDEGRFTVATKGGPGAVVGSYKIAVSAIRLKGPVSVNMSTEEILANEEVLIPKKYGNLKTSGLKAIVSEDASQNQYDFALK